MPSYLITGASRGVGLSFVQELLQDPQNVVIATARNPPASQGLLTLQDKYPDSNLKLVTLDTTDISNLNRAVEEVTAILPSGLDCVISNAAISLQGFTTVDQSDLEVFDEEWRVNVISQILVVRAFLPLIRSGKDKKVVFITSDMGSIELAPLFSGLGPTYSMTKAALNMLARTWGTSLRTEGITVVLLHPGWVATDLGNVIDGWITEHLPQWKKYTPEDSAERCIRVIKDAKLEDGVKYYDLNGAQLPW